MMTSYLQAMSESTHRITLQHVCMTISNEYANLTQAFFALTDCNWALGGNDFPALQHSQRREALFGAARQFPIIAFEAEASYRVAESSHCRSFRPWAGRSAAEIYHAARAG